MAQPSRYLSVAVAVVRLATHCCLASVRYDAVQRMCDDRRSLRMHAINHSVIFWIPSTFRVCLQAVSLRLFIHKTSWTDTQQQYAVAVERDKKALHCKKYPYVRYFVASLPYFNGTGAVYILYPWVDAIMKHGPTFQCWPAFHYSINLWMQAYTEPVTLKYGKLSTKYLWIYRHLLQCTLYSVLAVTRKMFLSRFAAAGWSQPCSHAAMRHVYSRTRAWGPSMWDEQSSNTPHGLWTLKHLHLLLYDRPTISFS